MFRLYCISTWSKIEVTGLNARNINVAAEKSAEKQTNVKEKVLQVTIRHPPWLRT